jgi:pimeloyl-ACP methyl ester carboxylesterase
MRAGASTRERRELTIGAGSVHVYRWPGAGPPTVFVHGLGGEAADWTDVVSLLPGSDCYAIDLPGFGSSPPPRDGRYAIAAQAATVAAVIDGLDVGPVRLVGNSLGGAVAVRVAATRPEVVSALALLCPALPGRRPSRSVLELLVVLVPVVGPALLRAFSQGDPGRMADRVFASCYADPAAVTTERRQAEIELIMRRAAQPHADLVYRRSLRSLVASNLQRGMSAPWRLAGRIGVPVLVVYGGCDRLVSAKAAARARTAFRDVRVVVLERGGHLPHLEHPDDVARLLAG